MLLSVISLEDSDMQDGAFKAAFYMFSQKTLGQLLKRVREKLSPPQNIDEYFKNGWNSRNWIVHEFLHSTVEDLVTPKGRLKAITRLSEAKQTVKQADQVANLVLDAYLKKYGVSVDALKESADRLWLHLNPKPSTLHN